MTPPLATVVGGTWLHDAAADDDLEAMAAARLRAVRIGLPWADAEPRAGRLDGRVVEQWRSRSDRARSLGLSVWCTLSAPQLPTWFDNDGGFGDERTAARAWPRWVDQAAQAVGDVVDGFVPLEAPFAMAARLQPDDPVRHGELMHHLVVAWRDAWRILRGGPPVATCLDVRVARVTDQTVPAAEAARREDQLRWGLWLDGLRDGVVSIPGRADRQLADLQGACDIIGLALRDDAEACLHRAAEQGPPRPLAVLIGLTGSSEQQRAEALGRQLEQCRAAAHELDVSGGVWVAPWRPGLVDDAVRPTAAGRAVAQFTGEASSESNADSAAPSSDASSPS